MRTFTSHVNGYYDVSDQMADDLRRRAEAHFRRQEQERAAITDVAQFEAERRRTRERFLAAIGGLPDERGPLQAQCTGVIDRGSYTIEKTIYQSLPGFHVTANLYVPKGLTGRAPAILLVCGHSEAGKAEPRYQAVCVDLVENGFIVLAMDPPARGSVSSTSIPRPAGETSAAAPSSTPMPACSTSSRGPASPVTSSGTECAGWTTSSLGPRWTRSASASLAIPAAARRPAC